MGLVVSTFPGPGAAATLRRDLLRQVFALHAVMLLELATPLTSEWPSKGGPETDESVAAEDKERAGAMARCLKSAGALYDSVKGARKPDFPTLRVQSRLLYRAGERGGGGAGGGQTRRAREGRADSRPDQHPAPHSELLTDEQRVVFLQSRRHLARLLAHDITSTVLDAMLFNPEFDSWRHLWHFPSPPILDAKDTLGHGFKEMRMSADGEVEQMSNMLQSIDDTVSTLITHWDTASRFGVVDVKLPVGFQQIIALTTFAVILLAPLDQ